MAKESREMVWNRLKNDAATATMTAGVLSGHVAVGPSSYAWISWSDRARLKADNATEEPVDFRSLRDSYATHPLEAGVSLLVNQHLGHSAPSTTAI